MVCRCLEGFGGMTCKTCGKTLDRRNRSGLCKPCFLTDLNRSAAGNAKRVAALRATLARPENREGVCRQRREASRSRMAWCPLEYQDFYRTLTRSKMLPAATARAIVVAQVATDTRRFLATGKLQQSVRG